MFCTSWMCVICVCKLKDYIIFYAPNVATLGFGRIVPTIALYYRESVDRRINRGCF